MSANATAVTVLLERMLDELSDVDMAVWRDEPLDRQELRDRLDRVMRIACATLDILPESRAV